MSLAVQNFNPLRSNATLKVTFPPEFNIEVGPVNVTTFGGSLAQYPDTDLDTSERTLTI